MRNGKLRVRENVLKTHDGRQRESGLVSDFVRSLYRLPSPLAMVGAVLVASLVFGSKPVAAATAEA